jgi:hypothetical protein
VVSSLRANRDVHTLHIATCTHCNMHTLQHAHIATCTHCNMHTLYCSKLHIHHSSVNMPVAHGTCKWCSWQHAQCVVTLRSSCRRSVCCTRGTVSNVHHVQMHLEARVECVGCTHGAVSNVHDVLSHLGAGTEDGQFLGRGDIFRHHCERKSCGHVVTRRAYKSIFIHGDNCS